MTVKDLWFIARKHSPCYDENGKPVGCARNDDDKPDCLGHSCAEKDTCEIMEFIRAGIIEALS